MLKENFVKFIEEGICNNWVHPALTDFKGESFTYGETGIIILRLHEMYKRMQVKQGDKIALIGKNSSRWAIIYMSAISYGATIVPILPDFKSEDLHQLVNHSDSVLLFCEEGIFSKLLPTAMPELKAVFSLTNFATLATNHTPYEDIYAQCEMKEVTHLNFTLASVSNEHLAVISYTSGTTGSVKGVMLQNNSLAANIKYARENMPLNTGDKIVSFLPFAHAFGCAFELLFPFSLGCHITILTKTPSPQVVMQAFREIKPALILSVPLVIEKIYKTKILPVLATKKMQILLKLPIINNIIYKKINKSLTEVFGGKFRAIVIGGAPFGKDAELFFKKIKFPFTVGYGMTECGPLISYNEWQSFKIGSSGKVIDTLQVKIDSPNPEKTPGEILVKGEGVMIGYYKNDELTKDIIEPDGWMHTGDLGTLDKDGTIYIKGRSKTMLLGPSGQNIYPDEVESILNNMTGIAESLLVQRNNKLVALIYPDPDVVKRDNLSPADIEKLFKQHISTLNHRVPSFMNVTSFVIQKEEFIKTPKRSIKRFLYN